MKSQIIAVGLFIIATLSGCSGDLKSDGHLKAFAPRITRTEPLATSVAANIGAGQIGRPGVSLREHQVDLVVVLNQALEQFDRHVDFSTTPSQRRDPAFLAKSRTVYVNGLTPDQTVDALTTFAETLDIEQRKTLRNSLASQLLAASNYNCSGYLKDLRSGQVTARMGTDLISGLFSLQGAVAKLPQTAKRMSAYAGATGAIGATIDRDIFAQQAAELIADAIVQKRTGIARNLLSRMDEPYEKWPLGTVLANVSEYHEECTILRGLSSMREAVIARENSINSIRRAAAAVEAQDGTGAQVLAVLTGLDPNTYEDLSAEPVSSAAPTVHADLDRMEVKAEKCGEAILAYVKDDPSKLNDDTNAKLPECRAPGNTVFDGAVKSYLAAFAQNQFTSLLQSLASADSDKKAAESNKLIQAYAHVFQTVTAGNQAEFERVARARLVFANALDLQVPSVDAAKILSVMTNTLAGDDPLLPVATQNITALTLKGPELISVVKAAWRSIYETEFSKWPPAT